MQIILMFISSVLVFFFGDFDVSFAILISLMSLDYFSGVLRSWYTKTTSSKVGFRGIVKKVATIILVVIAVFLDRMMGNVNIIRSLVIFYLISNEAISIMENIGVIGIPIPEILNKALDEFKKMKGKK